MIKMFSVITSNTPVKNREETSDTFSTARRETERMLSACREKENELQKIKANTINANEIYFL